MLKLFSKKALSLLPENVNKSRYNVVYQNVKVGDEYRSVKVPQYSHNTSAKVEPKVFLANERTLVSYINMAVLIGTLSISLYNSTNETTSRYFGLVYSAISVFTILYGYFIYQRRLTLIKKKANTHFDHILGPIAISICLFVSVAYNFYSKFLI